MKKTCIALIILSMILLLYVPVVSAAEEEEITESESGFSFDDEDYELAFPEELENYQQTPTSELTSYDPRTVGYTTRVFDQGSLGICWATASMATYETSVYYQTGMKQQYSVEALRYLTSNKIATSGGNAFDIGMFGRLPNKGGNPYVAASYLTRTDNPVIGNGSNACAYNWVAPNRDSDIPLSESSTDVPQDIDSSFGNAYASDIEYVPENEFKDAIVSKGGVVFTLAMNNSCYNTSTFSLYNDFYGDSLKSKIHTVECVGWDDDYSYENFLSGNQPASDGAWLVKNSYGDDFGDNGYFWVSYEDETLNHHMFPMTVKVAPRSQNEYMLSYDYTPMFGMHEISITEQNNSACMANVYDVSELLHDYNKINKVMFFSSEVDSLYRIYMVPLGLNDNLTNITNFGSPLAQGVINYTGYKTVSFDNEYTIPAYANKIAIIVEITTDSNKPKKINGQTKNNIIIFDKEVKSSSSYISTINQGESYIYYNNIWTDLYSANSLYGNFCIRPTLVKSVPTYNYYVNPTSVKYNDENVNIYTLFDSKLLYSIKINNTILLYQDIDYTINNNCITFSANTLSEYTNDKKITISFELSNGQIVDTDIDYFKCELSGKVAVGQVLTVNTEYYDGVAIPNSSLIFVWQSSSNGIGWSTISGANSNTYQISSNDQNKYLRCRVKLINSSSFDYVNTNQIVIRYGDANLNEVLNISDVTCINRHVQGYQLLSEDGQRAADVDGDGLITHNDATLIQQYFASIIDVFPVEV